jgi:hypothetical protein
MKGSKLLSRSPLGKDIRQAIRQMLHNELSLVVEKTDTNEAVISMILHGKPVGEPITITADLEWERDHGHGGGSYVSGIRLDVK